VKIQKDVDILSFGRHMNFSSDRRITFHLPGDAFSRQGKTAHSLYRDYSETILERDVRDLARLSALVHYRGCFNLPPDKPHVGSMWPKRFRHPN
jgi:hypothetical protein